MFVALGNKKTRICTMADIPCHINAVSIFTRNQYIEKCNCLPDCTEITYDVEISQAQIRNSADDIILRSSLNETGYNLSLYSMKSFIFIIICTMYFFSNMTVLKLQVNYSFPSKRINSLV